MITFREITRENYMECLLLRVKEDQRSFVADNATSLTEARFEEGLFTRAVYSDGVMIGFVLFDYDTEIPGWSMSRFMIDKKFQHCGLGKAAAEEFLKFMRDKMKVTELFVSVNEENAAANALYKGLGFRFTESVRYELGGTLYRENRMKIDL